MHVPGMQPGHVFSAQLLRESYWIVTFTVEECEDANPVAFTNSWAVPVITWLMEPFVCEALLF
jgi:hypothetical protein